MKKRTSAFLTALSVAACMTSCGEKSSDENKHETAAASSAGTSVSAETSTATVTTAQVTEEGTSDLSASQLIHRKIRERETTMGEQGTWTVFVYLCGSDLESKLGMASEDLQEMINSSVNGKVRFVVQTGGASKWVAPVNPKACQRYLVADGEATCVYSENDVSMGDGKTLTDFLSWGVQEYPAANMGLILWDHGSGSINGVCFDEQHEGKGLLLKDIDAALYSVFDDMTAPFTFIGFDACLMGTAEAASLLATHAKYMIASQEIEPGSGWDYTKIGNYLTAHPECSGEEIGRIICDSFYDSCKACGRESGATLSVIDLSKIDSFIVAFDKYAEQLYGQLGENGGNFAACARAITKADNFGGNNRTSGYTNMVDAGGLIQAGSSECPGASEALAALNKCVAYKKNGGEHKEACGLSMFYPLSVVDGSQDLKIYKDIALSAFYLGLVDKVTYGAAGSDNIETYSNPAVLTLFGNDFSAENYSSGNGNVLTYTPEEVDIWDYIADYVPSEGTVTFKEAPALDNQGNYCFTLSDESLEKTDYVEALVYMLSDDKTEMLSLGTTGELFMNWNTGACADAFDGYWFSLGDGQLLPAALCEECGDYDIYIASVMLNDKETYLRFGYDYENTQLWIIDAWDGIEENGSAARSGTEIKKGDVIVPLYDAFILSSEEGVQDEYSIKGNAYTITEQDDLYFKWLPDGEYAYCFCINDIYGSYYTTDPVSFTVDGEKIHYSNY